MTLHNLTLCLVMHGLKIQYINPDLELYAILKILPVPRIIIESLKWNLPYKYGTSGEVLQTFPVSVDLDLKCWLMLSPVGYVGSLTSHRHTRTNTHVAYMHHTTHSAYNHVTLE